MKTEYLKKRLEEERVSVTPLQLEKLVKYSNTLQEWGKIHNLTASLKDSDIASNIIDSLYPLQYIPKPTMWLDVGSGAGFPAIVVAIIWSDTKAVLCEPRNKRASFLRYVSIELELEGVEVAKKRVEELDSKPFDMILSRAVGNTSVLMELVSNLVTPKTSYLLYKGSNVDKEIEDASIKKDYKVFTKGYRKYLYIAGKKECF